MPAYEHDHVSQRRTVTSRTSRPAAPLSPLAAVMSKAGNAAVSRALAVQRRAAPEQHEHSAGCEHGDSMPVQREALAAAKNGPSTPIDAAIHAKAEAAAGIRMPRPNVHRGPEAESLNKSFNSIAFATGGHMFLTRQGDNEATQLHEWHHVLKQSQGAVPAVDNGKGVAVGPNGNDHERNADAFSLRAQSIAPTAQPAGDDREDAESAG